RPSAPLRSHPRHRARRPGQSDHAISLVGRRLMILNEIAADQQIGFPILTVLTFLPLVGAAVLWLFQKDEDLIRKSAMAIAGLELFIAVLLMGNFTPNSAQVQFAERTSWIPAIGVGYHLGVDGISVLFIPLMLVGIVLLNLNFHEAAVASRTEPLYSFDFLDLLTVPVPPAKQTLIFFLMFFGFAFKAPIFPFHTWLPTALVEGPIVMSVVLA